MDPYTQFADLIDKVQSLAQWDDALRPALIKVGYEKHLCDAMNGLFDAVDVPARLMHNDSTLFDATFRNLKIEIKKAKCNFVLDLAKIHSSRHLPDLVFLFVCYGTTDRHAISLHVVRPADLYAQLMRDCHPGFVDYLDHLTRGVWFSTEIRQVQHQFHYSPKQLRTIARKRLRRSCRISKPRVVLSH
jgi:hypothetical protein